MNRSLNDELTPKRFMYKFNWEAHVVNFGFLYDKSG